MKKIFIVLIFYFTNTYASNEISGFTETIEKSILQNSSEFIYKEDAFSEQNNTIQPQLVRSRPLVPSTEYNLTDDLPYNPYTREILDYNKELVEMGKSDLLPVIEKTDKYPYGFDNPPHNCYTATPPTSCFDGKIPITYISVKFGEKASFKLQNISKKTKYAYDKYLLLQEKKYIEKDGKRTLVNKYTIKDLDKEDDLDNPKIAQKLIDNEEKTIEVSTLEDGGIYTVFGRGRSWERIMKINIIPYTMVQKKFFYIQLDGEEGVDGDGKKWNPLTEDKENSYTKEKITELFNNVYKQALVEPKIITEKKTDVGIPKPIKISQLYEVDMADPENNTFLSDLIGEVDNILLNDASVILNKATTYEEASKTLQLPTDPDSPYWHFVIAINKERKKWTLGTCKDPASNSIDLTYCNVFFPEDEATFTDFYVISPPGCSGVGKNAKKIEIRVKNIKSKGVEKRHYYAFDEMGNQIKNLADCDILFTDNGYPVVTDQEGNVGHAAALSLSIPKEPLIQGYLPQGSIVIAPRKNGESSHYALIHEIGHSYGLTDVAKYDDSEIKNKIEYAIYDYPITPTSTPSLVSYPNQYATTETNLMTWQEPVGKRIRYRDITIGCTGGLEYIWKVKMDKSGNYCKEGPDCEPKNITVAHTQLPMEPIKKEKNEQQWECIRNCYTIDLATTNRKNYWLGKGCKTEIITDVDKEMKKEEISKLVEKFSITLLKVYFPAPKILKYLIKTSPLNYLKKYFSVSELYPYFKFEDYLNCTVDETGDFCFTLDELKNCINPETKKACFKEDEINIFKENGF